MYPLVPCGYCGGGIQFMPEFAGQSVYCPHCGGMVQLRGGQEPAAHEPEPNPAPQPFHSSYRPRRKKSASILPTAMLGGGLAMITYYTLIRDASWMVVQLESPTDTLPAALWRRFSAGMDVPSSSGLFLGMAMTVFGLVCFTLGRKSK